MTLRWVIFVSIILTLVPPRTSDYLTSDVGTPPGCTGPVPSAAIASRSDLQVKFLMTMWRIIKNLVYMDC